MLKRTKKVWPFSKNQENTESVKHFTPISTVTRSSEWYRSIYQIPLNKFIDVSVDGNLSSLIIRGFPSQIELALAWEEIKVEYADALGDSENKLFLSLNKEVAILTLTLKQIEVLINILSEIYYPEFVGELNKLLRINYDFNPDNVEDYRKKLKSCFNRSRSIKIEIDLKTIQLKALEEKHSSSKAPYTRKYFQSVLVTLSDHAKYQLPDSITVSEYCERLKRFNDYCEQMKSLK